MALAAMAACAMLASCASFVGPREVDIPLYRLQAGLDRHFPLDNRALELFDIQLSRPELAILHDRDRVGLTMRADVAPFFLRQSWHASLTLSGRLYLDPSRNGVFMAEPSVDHLAIDGADDMNQRQLTKVANLVLDKVVRDVPLYSFHMEDLSYAGVQFVPTSIRTVPGALRVRLEPVK
ncbi:DUF1439 domain-containing protein [Massilia horti]|uniref:DUF1439 domain-containing protein n=2 Tax=Massilia horti TaxID=2562153 RepID=A0A4Y9SZZ4_9BURK|nr:DUF1439 domain-containing protein [Massilia horti]